MPTRDLKTINPEFTRLHRELKEAMFKYFCRCDFCQNEATDLHEALISGNDLSGIDSPEVWECVLFSQANLRRVCNTCNTVKIPSREDAYVSVCSELRSSLGVFNEITRFNEINRFYLNNFEPQKCAIYRLVGMEGVELFYRQLEWLRINGHYKTRLPRPKNWSEV